MREKMIVKWMLAALSPCLLLSACRSIENAGPQRTDAVLEGHASLKDAPAGAVEVMTGKYQSVMLGKPCPFRVFSPATPKWSTDEEHFHSSDGLRLVVYVMNLKGVPRPSKAPDRAIIKDLIKNNFLVVTVDFAGGQVTDHLEWQKDVNGLFCVFGGKWHTEQRWFTQNRKDLLQYPGPNKGASFTSFPHPGSPSAKTVPVNKAGIYVIPSGYSVEPHLVFKEDFKDATQRKTLFMDVVYPMPSPGTTKVPLLLEMSSTARGEYVVNANTPILYSWLFNGYAFASMSYARPEGNTPIHPLVHGLRYLQSQKDRFSLTGKVGTAGISKSSGRCYADSNLKENQKTDADLEPYGAETSRVEVCMPAVGALGGPEDWKTLGKSSPAAVLSWCQLNRKHRVGSENAGVYRKARDAYEAAGIGEKCLYLVSPLAGHEYDVYHLNEIMAFFDKHCK
ncbi:MAG: hypothetical protein VCG02_17280 [Verrucomicrobiota bacterium]